MMSGKLSPVQKLPGIASAGGRINDSAVRHFDPALRGDSDRPLRLRIKYGRQGTCRPVKTARKR